MHFADVPRVSASLLAGACDLHDDVVRRRRAAGDTPWNWNVGIASPGDLPAKQDLQID